MNSIDALVRRLAQIDGVLAACLIDPATGTVVGSAEQRGEIGVPVAAAAAADVMRVLALMTANLALGGEVEDVVVTLSGHFHVIRALPVGQDQGLLVLVTLDRSRANLAMAHREIRDLSA